VSKDTVLAEIELGEAGKGPPIPAKPSNLNASKRGPAPRPIHVFSTKRQMPCGVGQMGIARDLGKRPENPRIRPHDLRLDACCMLNNTPGMRTAIFPVQAFSTLESYLSHKDPKVQPLVQFGWLWSAVRVPKQFQ
jgi:hypothetical protein